MMTLALPLSELALTCQQIVKVRLHDATKLMRYATKLRCVNGLICATCDCCMLSQAREVEIIQLSCDNRMSQ